MRHLPALFLVLALAMPLGNAAAETIDRSIVYLRAPSEQGPALLADGLHLIAEIPGGYLALVPAADLARLANLGLDHRIVAVDDPETDVFVRHAQTAEQIIEPLTEDSEILYSEAGFAIMRMPTDEERLLPPLKDSRRVFRHALRFVETVWEGPDPVRLRTADPDIQDMVDSVTLAWIQDQTQTLEDFGNRHSQTVQGEQASYWLRDQFLDYGYQDVTLHSYNDWNDNVVCVKPGALSPEKHVVVGGHYDSVGYWWNPTNGPGADDNATGTVAVLAAALAMAPYDFEYTVVFIAFGGEEQGLHGSTAWANQAAAAGMQIEGALITDMLGYRHSSSPINVDIIFNTASQPMRTLIDDVIALYVPGHAAVNGYLPGGASSDHASFWNAGYRAILFFESSQNYSPYIHSPNDLIGPSVNDFPFMLLNVRTVVAATATMARPYEDLTSVGELPDALAYLQVHPNPFNPQTTLNYALPRAGRAELSVYCARGRLVDRPLAEHRDAGPGSLVWQAEGLGSGLYFARLQLDGEVLQTVKLSLVR